ncbi:hypothetical protein GOBAR_AA25043 [Gossypium barbadense]|uniref:Dirigent protein n=1 Tax=Gossypium barbadense TaxID=3634 RepID=A0A2P5WX33_GOSBA|nr:hypothetical protein GOBAR_AA25043 [Gossypium barbadense]
MASSSSVLLSKLILPLFITHIVLTTSIVEAQVEDTSLKLVRDALERPLPISLYRSRAHQGQADLITLTTVSRSTGLFILTLGVVQGSLAAGDDELVRKKKGGGQCDCELIITSIRVQVFDHVMG